MVATIGDVAREAGVSRSTVSSVLTGRKYVAPHTRMRIEKAIKKLDFTVNSGARALATSRTMTLGLALSFEATQYISTASTYIANIAERARQLGYRLTIMTDDDGVSEIRSCLASKAVDGLLLMELVEDDPRIDVLRGSDTPAVLVGMPSDTRGVDAIDFDYTAGGTLAVERLYAQGASKIAFVTWPEAVYAKGATYAIRARAAAEERARELGVPLDLYPCASKPRAMQRLLHSILEDHSYDGLLFHNDAAAPILGELLARHHRTGPAVTGLCSARVAHEHWLPFETIDTRPHDSTWAAVELLVGRLEGRVGPETRLLLEPLINEAAQPDD